ncbi:MAG: hypothetical protein WA631_10345 [Nitrososphaeraceae archaeon]
MHSIDLPKKIALQQEQLQYELTSNCSSFAKMMKSIMDRSLEL